MNLRAASSGLVALSIEFDVRQTLTVVIKLPGQVALDKATETMALSVKVASLFDVSWVDDAASYSMMVDQLRLFVNHVHPFFGGRIGYMVCVF